MRSRFELEDANQAAVALREPVDRTQSAKRLDIAFPRERDFISGSPFMQAILFILKNRSAVEMNSWFARVIIAHSLTRYAKSYRHNKPA